tara:strand:- start:34 stop:327 length:294 start_codon:yes stop_codon:yes gene_type:complete
MTEPEKIAKKINEFTLVDEKNNHRKQGFDITLKPSESKNSMSFSIRTEEELNNILDALDFKSHHKEPLIEKFNSLRTRFDIKRLERFIVVYNNPESI